MPDDLPPTGPDAAPTPDAGPAPDIQGPLYGPGVDAAVPSSLPSPDSRPEPSWVRGHCPKCGDDVVSNCYYIGGRGYIIRWECWSSLGDSPTCDYKRVL